MSEAHNDIINLTDIIHNLHEEQRQLVEKYETDKKKARIKIIAGTVGFVAGFAMTYVGVKMLQDKLEDN